MGRPLFLLGLLSIVACSPSLGGDFNIRDAAVDAADAAVVVDAKPGVDAAPGLDAVPTVDVVPIADVVPGEDAAPNPDVVPADVVPLVDVVPVVDVVPTVDVPPRICATDGDCADTDPCTTGERCDPATRLCVARPLDGDGDLHAPRVCGGDDCDDGNPLVFPGAAETCNGRDDDCDGVADDGATCGAGEVCRVGRCECDGARLRCGGACLDVATSNVHCGRCDNPCGVGSTCVAGSCACTAGTLCGTQCVDVTTSTDHCGGCGRACAAGETCTAGSCACPPGASCGEQCAGLSVIEVARVGVRAGNVIRIVGDSTAAWAAQNPGGVLASRSPIVNSAASCPRSTGQVVYRYVVTASVPLRVTTSNPGTRASYDTVLYATIRCAASISSACNDDNPELAATSGLTSRLLIEPQPVGTAIYIVLGGYSPLTSGAFDRGAYELTITEDPTLAPGATCLASGATGRCVLGYSCALSAPGSETGTCLANGTAPATTCRTSSPACDAGMTCAAPSSGTTSICVRDVGLGAACDDFNRCVGGSFCRLPARGAQRGTCVAPGTAVGVPCRATVPECDAGLGCAIVTSGARECRVPALANGPCSRDRTVCPSQYQCVFPDDGDVGTCRADGTVLGSGCRATSVRCDGAMQCLTATSGVQFCGNVAGSGAPCANYIDCAAGTGCYRTDPTDESHGVCITAGTAGGDCRDTAPRCDGAAVCSAETGPGVCVVLGGAGAACRWPGFYCAGGFTCVLNAGGTNDGVCRATGTVAGARCGSGGACAAGLTCSPPAPGVCSAAVVTDCDPLGGTTRCSAGQACIASSSVRGRCGAQGVETEPNDTAALSASRAVSTPSAFVGALAYGDIDCVPVVVPAGGNVVAFVSDGNGRCPITSGALALDLYDTDGVTVRLTTTQNGPDLCAHMDGGQRSVFPSAGGLVAGTYTVCARGVQSSTVRTANVASYVLTVAATP